LSSRSLEGPDGLSLGLALSYLPLEVDPALGVLLTNLADGHQMDGVVELPVASTTEAVEGPAPGGVLDGSHSGIGGELVPVGEPRDVAGVTDQRTGQDL
jgi:hypothetical protein